MRAFIAVNISEQVRENFRRIENRLITSDADVKWVRPGNAHLTLKFLGEIEDNKTETIKSILEEISGQSKTFEVGFSGLGFFPNEHRPRIIWIGINKGVNELRLLAEKIDDRMSSLGVEKEERGFSPHLTLGRFRSLKNLQELMKIIEKMRNFDAGCFMANGIHLIQSVLQPSGPVYTKLYTGTFLKND